MYTFAPSSTPSIFFSINVWFCDHQKFPPQGSTSICQRNSLDGGGVASPGLSSQQCLWLSEAGPLPAFGQKSPAPIQCLFGVSFLYFVLEQQPVRQGLGGWKGTVFYTHGDECKRRPCNSPVCGRWLEFWVSWYLPTAMRCKATRNLHPEFSNFRRGEGRAPFSLRFLLICLCLKFVQNAFPPRISIPLRSTI